MARRVSSPVFVGRRIELDRLTAALREAAGGKPGVMVVGGEAGVGKTRLAVEFSTRAGAAGIRILAGACVPVGETSLPYGPVAEAIRRFAHSADPGELRAVLGPARGELARLLPDLGDSGEADLTAPPAWARGRFFEALLGLIRRLSASAPLLLVVEDLHWADRATLDLLGFLERNLRDERLMLLATYRSDELQRGHPLAPFLAELERMRQVERVELAPLDEVELGRLIGGILGREPDPSLVATIHHRTNGNPYYAEELLALGDPTGPLPPTLRDVVLARVEGLAEPTRALLQVASVAGPRIDSLLLARVEGVEPQALTDALREAVTHHILAPPEGEEEAFAFRHTLLREAVYEDLLPGERRRLHARVAQALEDSSSRADPTFLAELAHHWAMAREPRRALAASVQAGLAARQAYAFADAQAAFERAIGLWDQVPEAGALSSLDRPGLLRLAGEAAGAAGALERAASHLREATRLVDPAIDPVRAGLLFDRLGAMALQAGDGDGSLAAHREAVRLVPADPPTPARARVLEGLARRLMLDQEGDASVSLALQAIEIARAAGAPDIEADALATLGPAQASLGEPDDGVTTLRGARDLARRNGDVPAAARAWHNLASLLEGEECLQEALASAEWSDLHGLGGSVGALTRCVGAFALYELGRWAEAIDLLEHVERVQPEGGARFLMRLRQAHIDIGRGDLEEAAGRLALPAHSFARGPAIDVALLAANAEMELLCARDELAGARAAADRALLGWSDVPLRDQAYHCGLLATALRVEADLAARAHSRRNDQRSMEAQRRGEQILEHARSLTRTLAEHRATVWRRHHAVLTLCEAEWARLGGTPSESLWCQAAQTCRDAGLLALRPYALLRQAEAILANARKHAAAAPILREARETARAMGAAPLVGQIEELARRGRIELEPAVGRDGLRAPTDAADRFRLTPREREVLALLMAGRTNRQIAEHLFIEPRTVGVHVSNILGKLGASGRGEAAALAHRLALVDPAGPPPRQAEGTPGDGARDPSW